MSIEKGRILHEGEEKMPVADESKYGPEEREKIWREKQAEAEKVKTELSEAEKEKQERKDNT